MSGALPYPTMSDNRSFISDHTRLHSGSFLYGRAYDEQHRPPVPKLQTAYRPGPAPSTSRHVPSPSSLSPAFHDPVRVNDSGPYGSPSDVHTPVSFSQALHHSPSYRDQYSQMNSPTYYSPAEGSLPYTYPQPSRPNDACSLASHSSSSHSPPAGSEQQLPSLQDKASPSYPGSRTSQKRREKPRIALSPDQPLTTQGKPRARVYVACIQCRARKIRCDGAKPTCHNCSRRTANGSEPLAACTYDSAPKRRGPDKNPGSRQRLTTQEITEGGKVRRRRRRDSAPTDKALPMAAQASSATSPNTTGSVPHTVMPQIRPPNVLTSAVEALTRAPPEGTTHALGKSDIYHGAQQSEMAQTSALNSNASSLVPSAGSLSHPSSALQRIVTVNEPQFPQVHTQVSSVQDYPHLSDIQYVGYLPVSAQGISELRDYEDETEQKPSIGAEPSMQFAREMWWDTVLALYGTHHHPQLGRGAVLTPGLRESLSQQITADLRFLFSASNYWFAFVNVPRFFSRLLDPAQRTRLQPSLILAALAAANFIRSSEQENGAKGRAWALSLRERAQGALDASLNARWIDESLVQACWLITFFEISAHPLHSSLRVRSALSMLDSLVRTLAISSLDRNDNRVSLFSAHTVPTVSSSASAAEPVNHWSQHASHATSAARAGSPPGECSCAAYTLGNNWAHAQELTPLWLMTPAWNKDVSDAETRKEEARRLVWSCVTLIAGYTSYTAASNPLPTMDLFLMDPANYALLFPGESLAPLTLRPASKDTVWALYMRTVLLWHSCVRMRSNASLGEAEKAQFAVSAWLEIDRIEDALNAHTCGIERAFLFQGREYLFNARMCISYEFQRYIPQATANANLIFHRKKAEEWLTHQASVAKRTMFGLQTITGQPNVGLSRRPFFIFWFMSQVSRALMLWSCDNTLTVALDVGKALLGPIEYMMSMWPCPEQQKRYKDLRESLAHACYVAGLPAPSPMNLAVRLPTA